MTFQLRMKIDVEEAGIAVCAKGALNNFPAAKLLDFMQVRARCHDCNWKFRPDAWLDGQSENGISPNCKLASQWLNLISV